MIDCTACSLTQATTWNSEEPKLPLKRALTPPPHPAANLSLHPRDFPQSKRVAGMYVKMHGINRAEGEVTRGCISLSPLSPVTCSLGCSGAAESLCTLHRWAACQAQCSGGLSLTKQRMWTSGQIPITHCSSNWGQILFFWSLVLYLSE